MMRNWNILGIILAVLTTAFPVYGQTPKTVGQLDTQNDVIRNETVPGANTRGRIADMNKSIYVSSPNLFGTYAYPQSWLTGYQPTLVSGTSLKTINSTSLLGSGDIVIGGLSGLTINKILYATSSSTAGNGPDWDATNNALTINSARIFQLNNSIKDLFIGESAGNFTATGGGNIGIGKQVLTGNTSGTENIMIGRIAGQSISTPSFNIGIGLQALGRGAGMTGAKNIAIGYTAGATISTGNFNIKIGQVGAITTGSSNVEIGDASQVPSATSDGQLSIQNIIYGTGNTNQGSTTSTGNIGIGVQAPTARLHLPAGTATAGTAPLKIPSGTNLTTTEAGVFENNGTHLFFTFANGGSRFQLDQQSPSITVGTTPIVGGSDGKLLYDNSGILGESNFKYSTSGSTLIFDASGTTNSALNVRVLASSSLKDVLTLGDGAGTYNVKGFGNSSHVFDQTGASTNTIKPVMVLSASTTGTPGVGIGPSIRLQTQTGVSAFKIGSEIQSVSKNIGVGTETFDIVFNSMDAGATASEKLRISSLGGIVGTNTNNNASTGIIGEELNSTISTYTNYTTTATYQNVTSITLTAGDWDISGFLTYSSNGATITAASNAIFVIGTTTASASGTTEGLNIAYIPQAALLGTSKFSENIAPYRVSLSGTTTYYLNAQATFTLGNPQYVGSIRARRIR